MTSWFAAVAAPVGNGSDGGAWIAARPLLSMAWHCVGVVRSQSIWCGTTLPEPSGLTTSVVPDPAVTVSVKATLGNQIFVVGKVNHPGQYPLNRPVDVMQALSIAGGTTPFAELNHIRVLRRDGARLISIDFRYGAVEHGRNLQQNILLQSGDTVVVP